VLKFRPCFVQDRAISFHRSSFLYVQYTGDWLQLLSVRVPVSRRFGGVGWVIEKGNGGNGGKRGEKRSNVLGFPKASIIWYQSERPFRSVTHASISIPVTKLKQADCWLRHATDAFVLVSVSLDGCALSAPVN
jgi:hypothetical protein